VFSIDPAGCVDIDDAFSIQLIDNTHYRVSVYIANVFVWLETFQLWGELTSRPSTIYLPDRKRCMLPARLSDDLCSLHQDQFRFALAMDIILDLNGNRIVDRTQYKNVIVRVKKNFAYEEPSLLKNTHYKSMFTLAKSMDASIRDSHDVVAHFMVLMNVEVGQFMKNLDIGIFRASTYISQKETEPVLDQFDIETRRMIRNWNNTITEYTTSNNVTQHVLMGVGAYVHITSPIRRIVDLLNQTLLFKYTGVVTAISEEASIFVADWMNKLEYINHTTKTMRKVQHDCDLLTLCVSTPEIMDNVHTGIIMDKDNKTDTLFTYTVYIEDIKMMARVSSTDEYSLYKTVQCKLYLFQDEDRVINKIRTTLVKSV
jgi:exoribonuclease R